MKTNKKAIKVTLLVVTLLILTSLGLGFSVGLLEAFRLVFGSMYVLFLPGFIISFLFFPKTDEKKGIDWIERIALSFALSISIIPLVVFYLNLAGVKVSAINTCITAAAIIAVSFGIMKWKK